MINGQRQADVWQKLFEQLETEKVKIETYLDRGIYAPGRPGSFTLEEEIVPSINSIDLKKTPVTDRMMSLTNKSPNIGELYHCNSNLNPHSMYQVSEITKFDVSYLRTWYFSTGYAVHEEMLDPDQNFVSRISIKELPGSLQKLLEPFTQAGAKADLLFGTDLFVYYDRKVAKLLPESDYLWVVRKVSDDADLERLKDSLLEASKEVLDTAQAFLFVIGVWARYMFAYGARGYRHTLMEAGRLLSQIESTSAQLPLRVTVAQNFYDEPVNAFLLLDGVERGTLAAVVLSETQNNY